MSEKELIQKIQLLKQVKPSQNWVVSLKKGILGRELGGDRVSPNWIEVLGSLFTKPIFVRPAFVTVLSIFVIIGTFNLGQNSLPGSLLYPIKQLTEKVQTVFVSESEKPALRLEFANQRIEELAKIGAKPGPKNDKMIAALKALNSDLSAASKQIQNVQPEQKEALASKTGELIKKTQAVLGNLEESGVEGFETVLSQIVAREIQDLENRTLTEEQTQLLNEAKQDFEAGNFSQALEKIWQISNR